MTANLKDTKGYLYVSLLAFVAFLAYILYINQEVLYAANDRSEFLYGSPFFYTQMSKPFGLIRYVGAWLTQLFYYPALGAGVLAAIWAMIFCVGKRAFRLQGNASALLLLPIACLLTSIVDLGYWIYILPIRGYWFSQSVGYLLMLALLWVARLTPRDWHWAWYLLGACLYPILGWFAMLFVLCLMLVEKPSWKELIGLILIPLSVAVWRSLLYSALNMEDVALAGFPRFVTPSAESDRLAIPFWILGGVTILIPWVGSYLNKCYVAILSAVLGIALTISLMYYDRNFIDEIRMVRAAETEDWQEVIDVAEAAKEPTVSMVMLKNVALMNEGNLLDRSFQLGNISHSANNPDSLRVSFLEIASPVIYYNYGMLNEGFRLAFECAVQSGFSPFYLRSLARCAHANGEDNLADRYIVQMQHRLFCRDWKPAPVSAKISELHGCYPDEITGVVNSDGYLVNSISMWYGSDSKLAAEQAVFYSMIRRDSRRFWASLRKYVKTHMNEDFPVAAQEAYIMYMDKAPEEKRMMIPVSQEIYERYQAFWTTIELQAKPGMKQDDLAEVLRPNFGDTYWYYNLFNRKQY